MENSKKRKRELCDKCQRWKSICICAALPSTPLLLSKSRLIVIEHPHERKRKDRSLPLIEKCFKPYHPLQDESTTIDFGIYTYIGRRFGDQMHPSIYGMLNDEKEAVLFVYPSDDAIPLRVAINQIDSSQKVNLIFIDATWKHAKEMQVKSSQAQSWPKHMIRVKLEPDDFGSNFIPRRFEFVRTPPTDDYLSTAECIARVLQMVEQKPEILDILMKPLDLMVAQWKSFEEKNRISLTKDGNVKIK